MTEADNPNERDLFGNEGDPEVWPFAVAAGVICAFAIIGVATVIGWFL